VKDGKAPAELLKTLMSVYLKIRTKERDRNELLGYNERNGT
jgi:hypothetical protein